MSAKSIIILAIFFLSLALITIAYSGMDKPHSCYAPCTVKFDGPMAEDNFGIDYVGKGPGKGELKVFRVQP